MTKSVDGIPFHDFTSQCYEKCLYLRLDQGPKGPANLVYSVYVYSTVISQLLPLVP